MSNTVYLTMYEVQFKQHKGCVLDVLSVDSVMKLFTEEHSLSFSQMTRNVLALYDCDAASFAVQK